MGSTLRIGNVEILALKDTEGKAPTKMLFPTVTEDQWAPFCAHLADDCRNLPMTIPSFIVRSQGKTLVIDTGIGAKDRPFFPNGRLPEVLREEGIAHDDVDVVMATHIHIDHVGWHTTQQGESFVPTFPKADHVFVREEFEFFTAPEQANNPQIPWVNDCVLPLQGKAQITLVDSEFKLTDEVTLLPTPGHTPAHSAIAIMSAGEAAVIIGDVCHSPAQVTETSWSPIFDLNPALAAQSREALMQRIEAESMTVVAGHFAYPGFGRIVRVDNRRTWQAI